jgi:hypothetical protein
LDRDLLYEMSKRGELLQLSRLLFAKMKHVAKRLLDLRYGAE